MFIYLLTALGALTISVFVYVKNPRANLHRYYLLFTITNIAWLSGVLLVRTPSSLLELHFKSLFGFAAFMSYFLFLFVAELISLQRIRLTKIIILSGNIAVAIVSLFTDLVTESVYLNSASELIPTRGTLYAPALMWVMITGFLSIAVLLNALRDKKLDPQARYQVRIVFLGVLIAVSTATLTNVILPALTGNITISNFAPISLLVLSFSLGYAIWKHRLFDIRSAVARAVAYAVSIAFIIGIFVSIIALISSTDLFSEAEQNVQRVFFIVLSISSAIIYQPIKAFFDKLTNAIFYRDAYDPQVLIDAFNRTLVTTVDLELLLQRTAALIQDSLKASSVVFYMRKTSSSDERIIDSAGQKVEINSLDLISEKSVNVIGKIFSAEFDESKDIEPELFRILKKNDTAVLARLVSTDKFKVQGAGLLFVGTRQSGSLYSEQDLRVLNIIANELIIAIENILRYEEIEQFNVTLQKKTDAATRELKRSNEKLLALDQAKDEFVSMASHQLRTPLTSIKGYVAMVLDGDAGKLNDTQQQMLKQTFISSQRMVYLISDLLNVSRLKTGKFQIEARPIMLSELVESELSQLQDEIQIKELKLKVDLPINETKINIDEMKTRQVVMNFVDNAIYYTAKGGSIHIEVQQTKNKTTFTVKDSGIGVPKEQQKKLFTKFYRADNARKIRPDGTGLGLFMAKKVIEAQGGEVLFSSTENSGSMFGFAYNNQQQEVEQ